LTYPLSYIADPNFKGSEVSTFYPGLHYLQVPTTETQSCLLIVALPFFPFLLLRCTSSATVDILLDGLFQVFESARARERERELLYPGACGGGRGWFSQSSGSFRGSGRGHRMKETCALHTARLSCEALVDFWSALGEETRRSLLRMKEEDFIERLMFR
jgi:hypothetical protein